MSSKIQLHAITKQNGEEFTASCLELGLSVQAASANEAEQALIASIAETIRIRAFSPAVAELVSAMEKGKQVRRPRILGLSSGGVFEEQLFLV